MVDAFDAGSVTRDGDDSRSLESAADASESEVAEVADAEGAGSAVGDAEDADSAVEDGDTAGSGAEGPETADSVVEGVDTEHVMNLTFVLTLVFGVPTVVVLSLFVPLDGWNEIVMFVVRVAAAIWFLTAVGLYVRERWWK